MVEERGTLTADLMVASKDMMMVDQTAALMANPMASSMVALLAVLTDLLLVDP